MCFWEGKVSRLLEKADTRPPIQEGHMSLLKGLAWPHLLISGALDPLAWKFIGDGCSLGAWYWHLFATDCLLICYHGKRTLMVFCLGLAPAYSVFVVLLEVDVDVTEMSDFSSNKFAEDVDLNCLKLFQLHCKEWPTGSEGKCIPADPLWFVLCFLPGCIDLGEPIDCCKEPGNIASVSFRFSFCKNRPESLEWFEIYLYLQYR